MNKTFMRTLKSVFERFILHYQARNKVKNVNLSTQYVYNFR